MIEGEPLNWHDHILSDPSVLVGKPVSRGTRLSVNFLLGLMAEGWTEEQLLENYPQLRREALQAMYAFAAERTRDEQVRVMSGNAG